MPTPIPYIPDKANADQFAYAPPTLADGASRAFIATRPLAADTWGPLFDEILWIVDQLAAILNPVVLAYAATLTPDTADGLFRTCTLTGNATLDAPANPADGMTWQCLFKASSATRTLTLDSAIILPSGSPFYLVAPILSGKELLVTLRYDGAAWLLITPDPIGTAAAPTLNTAAKTASYNIAANDCVILCDTVSTAITITVPTAVGCKGKMYIIKDATGHSGVNAITVAMTSGQTVDGFAPSPIGVAFAFLRLMSDGANWLTI